MIAIPKGIIQKPRIGRNPTIPPAIKIIPTIVRKPLGIRWMDFCNFLNHACFNILCLCIVFYKCNLTETTVGDSDSLLKLKNLTDKNESADFIINRNHN